MPIFGPEEVDGERRDEEDQQARGGDVDGETPNRGCGDAEYLEEDRSGEHEQHENGHRSRQPKSVADARHVEHREQRQPAVPR